MKVFSVLSFVMGIASSVIAQRDTAQALSFGITPSMNYRLFTKVNSETEWLKNQHDSLQCLKWSTGAFVHHEFGITEKRSFFVGIAYSDQGYQYKDQAIKGFQIYKLNFHYLQFPLGCNFYFRVNELLQLSVQPSINPSVLISSRAVSLGNDAYTQQRSSVYPYSTKLSLQGHLAFGLIARIDQNWAFRSQIFFLQQINPLLKGDLSGRLYSGGIQIGLSRRI